MNDAPGDGSRPFVRLPTSLAPLGYRNYLLYLIGFATSRLGRAIEETGAVWLVYDLTTSPALLGLLGIARAGPAIVLSPIAGVIADRVDQRRFLAVTQALGLISSLTLGVLVLAGDVQLWQIYLQVAIQAGIQAIDGGIRQAMFPRLVPRAHLPEAITLNIAGARTSALIGPVIGGVTIATLGVAAPFLLNAASFVVLMAALLLIRGIVARVSVVGSTFRGELREGIRYILARPVLSGLLRLEVVFGLIQVNPVIITVIGLEVLAVGPEGLGGLLAAPALGALLGIAGLLMVGQTRHQGRFVIVCAIAYAAFMVVLAVSTSYLLSFGVLACIGLLDTLAMISRHSVVQLAVPERMRGRIMGNMGTITRGTGPLAEAQSGVLAGAIGPPLAVVVAASILAAAAAYTGKTNHALRRFRRDDVIEDQDEDEVEDEVRLEPSDQADEPGGNFEPMPPRR